MLLVQVPVSTVTTGIALVWGRLSVWTVSVVVQLLTVGTTRLTKTVL